MQTLKSLFIHLQSGTHKYRDILPVISSMVFINGLLHTGQFNNDIGNSRANSTTSVLSAVDFINLLPRYPKINKYQYHRTFK